MNGFSSCSPWFYLPWGTLNIRCRNFIYSQFHLTYKMKYQIPNKSVQLWWSTEHSEFSVQINTAVNNANSELNSFFILQFMVIIVPDTWYQVRKYQVSYNVSIKFYESTIRMETRWIQCLRNKLVQLEFNQILNCCHTKTALKTRNNVSLMIIIDFI